MSTEERTKVEALLARAEALEAHSDAEAVDAFREARRAVEDLGPCASSSARSSARPGPSSSTATSRKRSSSCCRHASSPSGPEFSDIDRAEVLFRLGACRWSLSSISTAIALFDEALELAERSGPPATSCARTLGWRSRCHRRLRDYVAAREDVEHALELAQDLGDRRAIANTYFQASLIAQRQGNWVLARLRRSGPADLYQELNDERNVGRLLLALGGLTLLLGDEDSAVEHLEVLVRTSALETDSQRDAAQALGGLATVHPCRGEYDQADELARKALDLLQGRGPLAQVRLVAARTGTSADGARAAG